MKKQNLREKQGVYAVHVIAENDVNYIYVGSGFLGDRVSGNVSKLKRQVHANKQLQEAYDKYNNVKVEILEICDDATEARDLENSYVEHYKRLDGVIVCNKYKAFMPTKQYKRTLNESDVIAIHKLVAEGERNKDVAVKYDVDPSTISRIKNGVRWPSLL